MLQDKDFVGDEKVLNMRLQQRAGCQSMLMMRECSIEKLIEQVFQCLSAETKRSNLGSSISISPSRTSSMFIFLPKQTPKLFRQNVALEMLVGSGRDHLHLEQKQEFKKCFSIPGENRVGFGSSCKTGKLRLHFFTDSVGNQQQQQLQQKKEP